MIHVTVDVLGCRTAEKVRLLTLELQKKKKKKTSSGQCNNPYSSLVINKVIMKVINVYIDIYNFQYILDNFMMMDRVQK